MKGKHLGYLFGIIFLVWSWYYTWKTWNTPITSDEWTLLGELYALLGDLITLCIIGLFLLKYWNKKIF